MQTRQTYTRLLHSSLTPTNPQAAVAVCTVGGLLGWPFAGLAAVPVGVVALRSSGVARTARTLALSASTLLPCFAADWALYGRPTLGVWNLVAYNVVGNDSGLYGTEPASFYFRAALNALNLALPLALAGPLAELLVAWALRRRPRWALALVGLSFHLWVGAMSCVPHKEDRFLYPVYAHALLAAATALDVGCEAGGALGRRGWLPGAGRAAAAASALLVLLAAALSLSRSAALVSNYGAPMRLLAGLAPLTSPGASALLCVGDEWYRFPSSFFLPGDGYSLGFVQQPGGFAGALPARFGPLPGWSSAAGAAPWLNDRNAAAPQQWVVDPDQRCDLWLGLASEAPPGGAAAGWTAVARAPFLDAARSPALWRAFRVPLISARRNTFVEMVLLSRQRAPTQP